MSFILIYSTYPTIEEAKKISNHLLDKKLIACVNYSTISSSYHRKGEIETAEEIVGLLKTKSNNREQVKEVITQLHSYETPCIIKIPVEANTWYEERIQEETNTSI